MSTLFLALILGLGLWELPVLAVLSVWQQLQPQAIVLAGLFVIAAVSDWILANQ